MHANNRDTVYSAGSGDWTQVRLITVSGSAAHCANEPLSLSLSLLLHGLNARWCPRHISPFHEIGPFIPVHRKWATETRNWTTWQFHTTKRYGYETSYSSQLSLAIHLWELEHSEYKRKLTSKRAHRAMH